MKSNSKTTIAFFIGSATAANVQTLLKNLGAMLGSEFNLHLIVTTPEELNNEVINHFDVYGGGYSPTFVGGVQAFWTYNREQTPDVAVQLTAPPIHGLLVGAIARKFEVPSVYRYSGDRFYVHRILSGTEKTEMFILNNIVGYFSANCADKHIVLGPTGKQRLVRRGINPEDITILPPTVDTDRIRENDETADLDIPKSRSVALFLGRLHPRKGLATLETTIPRILTRRDDLQFVFVGGTYDFDVPERVNNHITFVGRVQPGEVSAYLHRADVLVHPSLTEGVPRAVLESLAAGTPVVARDVGDIKMVTDNTFTTDDEFVDKVCKFEELPIEDVKPYTRRVATDRYTSFFRQF